MADWKTIETQLRSGKPICIYDFPGREDETDVVYIGHPTEPHIVDFIRREVGGPLAVYLSSQFLQRLGILSFSRFVTELGLGGTLQDLVKLNHGHDPRFAISIDARNNVTGCSPVESSNTIRQLHDLAVKSDSLDDQQLNRSFAELFISPGHVPLIRAADGLLAERKGHAELSLTIAQIFNLPEIVVAGELVDPDTLNSMKRTASRKFAEKHQIPYVTGNDILAYL